MKNKKARAIHFFAVAIFVTLSQYLAHSQVIYAWTLDDNLVKIDLATCTACKVGQMNGGNGDLVFLPDGRIVTSSGAGNQILIFTPPNPNPSQTIAGPFNHYYYTMSEPINGLIYITTSIVGAGQTGITVLDPVSGTLTYLGNLPGSPPWSLAGMYVENGNLYAVALLSSWTIVQINLTNPSASTLVGPSNVPIPYPSSGGDMCSGIYTTGVNTSRELVYQYDPASNSVSLLCDFSSIGFINQLRGLTPELPGLPELPCVCVTSAGSLNPNLLHLCTNSPTYFPVQQSAVLDEGDGKKYILFTDPLDTLGSTLVISNTPYIPFDPAIMQTGVTYYLAIMVGPLLPSGDIDTSAPCFDLSNATPIIWHEPPSVQFSVANPDVCEGSCVTIQADFTGTPPFTLTVANPFGGSNTYDFVDMTGTFEICAPVGATIGNVELQAIDLVDFFCTCE